MTRHDGLSQWIATVSTNLPPLSTPQATALAMWSFGIACTRSCGRLTVATFWGLRLGQKVDNLEQRLDEWCLAAPDKAGKRRTDLEVTTCFVALLAWIVRLWGDAQVALTIDCCDQLGDALCVVLATGVALRGCAIPVAWTMLPAGKKRAWRHAWLRMRSLLQPAIPRHWTVIGLADRGWYARWRFTRISDLGWHPYLRINQGGKFRPPGGGGFVWLQELGGTVGLRWRGRGTAFSSTEGQLDCPLVAWWGAGHAEPWFILTDLDPASCDAQWYALRGWCEQSFK